MKRQHLLLLFAIVLYLFGLYTLTRKIEPFQYFFYATSWWSYIVFIDATLFLKYKRFFILSRSLFVLIIFSSGYWCLFELINIRLQNWSYIHLPSEIAFRYLGYFLGFGTVIPAIYVTQEAIKPALEKIRIQPTHIRYYSLYAMMFGGVAFILTIAAPKYCFPLAWVFALFFFDGINYGLGFSSLVRDLQEGRVENILSSAIAGFICGFLWEFWNFWSLSKWVYSVPFFSKGKMFEMPLPGYIGFIAFGLGTIAFVNFLKGIRRKKRWYYLAVSAAVLCSVISFPLIDSYTVHSYASKTATMRSCNR